MLSNYLNDVSGRACRYGSMDCAILMADWLMRCGWPDPMLDRRGTYSDKPSFRLAIKSEGGLLASCSERFLRIGLKETEMPVEGDVAVVSAPFAIRHGRALHQPVGAIVLAGGFVALLSWPRGIVGARLPIMKAWSSACG